MTQVGTWPINAIWYSSGVTTGTITNVDVKISGSLCTAEVAGTVSFTYINSTGILAVSPDDSLLKVKSASCLGVLNTDDVIDFTGSFQDETSPFLQITSP